MNLLELDPAGNSRVSKGWTNHPAVKMWRGHEGALYEYVVAMVVEWKQRGYNSTIAYKAAMTLEHALLLGKSLSFEPPSWIADQKQLSQIAATHRQALLVKDYGWYSQWGWPEDTGLEPISYEYLWPVVSK